MLEILSITTPIYLAVLLGYFMTRMGVFSKADMAVLGKFVIRLGLPAMLFMALAQSNIRAILNPGYLLAYLAGSLLVVLLGFLWLGRRPSLGLHTKTIYVMGISCSNSAFVGFPILLLSVPTVAGVALALNMIVENIFVLPLLIALAEAHGGQGRWYRIVGQSLARLIRVPMVGGLILGASVSALGWKLPQPLSRTATLFAQTSGALSLFFIGGTLVGLPLQGIWRRAVAVAASKLILHPLAVLLMVLLLPLLGLPALEPSMQEAAVLLAAMPMLGIYPIMARQYGQEEFSSAALLVTTVLSFFTISALLWVIRHAHLWS